MFLHPLAFLTRNAKAQSGSSKLHTSLLNVIALIPVDIDTKQNMKHDKPSDFAMYSQQSFSFVDDFFCN